MRRTDVVVLHAYGPRVAVLEGDERAALLDQVTEFFDGIAPRFTAFELGELRDDRGRAMLAVQESC